MSQDKRHPQSSYGTQFPFNRIHITESGHEIHFDDTPGKERIRVSHKAGTYFEVSHDGKLVSMSVGNRVDYVKQGLTTTVDKNHDHKVGGSSRTSISGGSHTEVKGTHSIAVDGDMKSMVGKDVVTAVKGDMVTGVTGATKLRLGGGIEIKGDQNIDTKIDAAANISFGDTLTIYVKNKMALHSDDEIEIISPTKITLQVGSSHIIILPDGIHIKAQNVYVGGGDTVNVKSGTNKADPDWVNGAQPPQ